MHPPLATPPQIGPAPPQRHSRALWLAFSDHGPTNLPGQVADTLAAAHSGQIKLNGLLEAQRDGVIVGAALANVLPGRTAVVYPPQIVPDEPDSTSEALFDELDRFLVAQGVLMAQTLLTPDQHATEARLERAGFHHLADLTYLVCPAAAFPAARPQGQLAFEPYRDVAPDRMSGLIERTYQGTLDCPQLDDVRQLDDVMDSYRHTGEPARDGWLYARLDGQDVGCLLLADHAAQRQYELVYMGLVPEARGQGLGLQITRHAQWLARCADRQQLVLAVDADNRPAVETYEAAGFTAWGRRRVFWKTFAP